MKTQTVLTLTICSLTLAALACTIFAGGPNYPQTPIAVSTEAIGSLDDQIHTAQTAAAQSGTLTLTINESQITSLLAAKLDGQNDPFITDPQVYLRDGKIQVYGKAVQGNIQANVRVVLTATLTDGKPVIAVESADFGPLPAPENLNHAINSLVGEAFTGALGPAALGFRLQNITIADGIMTLTGRVK
jgi:hypothetical protein